MHSMTARAGGLSALLPGQIVIERGTRRDYGELAHLHYAPGHPATWAGIWRAVWSSADCGLAHVHCRSCRQSIRRQQSTVNNQPSQIIAVGVLSYPTPAHRVRERVLRLSGPRYGEKLRFINEHVRTISRVIVHPQFRGLGIASQLVRRICEDCPTRYVEAIAAMGEVHPLFERAGMVKVPGDGNGGRAYFIFDREQREGVEP
jgi:GNAT superfamily N-acetyltransferase